MWVMSGVLFKVAILVIMHFTCAYMYNYLSSQVEMTCKDLLELCTKRTIFQTWSKILARLEFGLQDFYDSSKICKNLVNILQEKDHFLNKYTRFLQVSYKIGFARNLQSLAHYFLLGCIGCSRFHFASSFPWLWVSTSTGLAFCVRPPVPNWQMW